MKDKGNDLEKRNPFKDIWPHTNKILLNTYIQLYICLTLLHFTSYLSSCLSVLSVLLAANHFFAQGKEAQDTLQTQRMEDDRTGPGLGTHSQLT